MLVKETESNSNSTMSQASLNNRNRGLPPRKSFSEEDDLPYISFVNYNTPTSAPHNPEIQFLNANTSEGLELGKIYWVMPKEDRLGKIGAVIKRAFNRGSLQKCFTENFFKQENEDIAKDFLFHFFTTPFNKPAKVYVANKTYQTQDKRHLIALRYENHPYFNQELGIQDAIEVLGTVSAEDKNRSFNPVDIFPTQSITEALEHEQACLVSFTNVPNVWDALEEENIFTDNFIDQLPEYGRETFKNFNLWEDFITFREKLAKFKSQGLLFINSELDLDNLKYRFVCIARKEEFDQIKRALTRTSISLFEQKISSDRVSFNIEHTDPDKMWGSPSNLGEEARFKSYSLVEARRIFKQFENATGSSQKFTQLEREHNFNTIEQIAEFAPKYLYTDPKFIANYEQLNIPVESPYEGSLDKQDAQRKAYKKALSTYLDKAQEFFQGRIEHFDKYFTFCEVTLELSDSFKDALDNIARKAEIVQLAKQNGDELERKDLEDFNAITEIDKLFRSVPEVGYLSVSMTGDFALNRRHRNTIKNLKRGENCFAPRLATYLFDITKAQVPNQLVEVEQWHNTNLNADQKLAVRKMLSAPDLCLVQGPPGTGKTTVIAEACLQFAKRGDRILISSQSHDAIDNAISRLSNRPELRPIRLAKNLGRITDDGKQFVEKNALARHYHDLEEKNSQSAKHIEKLNERIKQLLDGKVLVDSMELEFDKISQRIEAAKAQIDQVDKEREQVELIYKAQRQQYDQRETRQSELGAWKSILESDRATETPNLLHKLPEALNPVARMLQQLAPANLVGDFSDIHEHAQGQFRHLKQQLVSYRKALAQVDNLKQDLQSLVRGEFVVDESLQGQLEDAQRRQDDIVMQLRQPDADFIGLSQQLPEINALIVELKKQIDAQSFRLKADYNIFKDRDAFNIIDFNDASQVEPVKALLQQRVAALNLLPSVQALIPSAVDNLEHEIAQVGKCEKPSREQLEALGVKRQQLQNQLDRINQEGHQERSKYNKLVSDLGCNPDDDIDDILDQIDANVDQAKLELQNIHTENPLQDLVNYFQDVLEESSHNVDADWETFGNTFIKNCNLVAISCNEDPRTLEKYELDRFDVVIIDEVSKATPLEMLFPLMLAKKAVLVGDHRQLPPLFNEADGVESFEDVVFAEGEPTSSDLTKQNLERFEDLVSASLFKKLFERAPEQLKQRLNVQFRMHPEIMGLVNKFYGDNLTCGNPDAPRKHGYYLENPLLPGDYLLREEDAVLWVDTYKDQDGVVYKLEAGEGNRNKLEADLIVRTLIDLNQKAKAQGYDRKNRLDVGVVAFYQPQLKTIRESLKRYTGGSSATTWFDALNVEVNTVIRYQGKEKPIILISMVKNDGREHKRIPARPNPREGGHATRSAFVSRFEFINVAMSRAQNLLMIFGARNMMENREVELPAGDEGQTVILKCYKEMFMRLERDASKGNVITAKQLADALPKAEEKAPSKPGGASSLAQQVKDGGVNSNSSKKGKGKTADTTVSFSGSNTKTYAVETKVKTKPQRGKQSQANAQNQPGLQGQGTQGKTKNQPQQAAKGEQNKGKSKGNKR